MKYALALFLCLPSFGQMLVAMVGGNEVPRTPVDSNSGGGCTGSSGAWTCTGAATITITDATASLIYYTTNGATPACPATGTLYTTPFTGPGTTFTLKAIGCNGFTGGGVLSSVYTIGGGTSSITQVSGKNCSASSGGGNASSEACTITGQTAGHMNIVAITFCENSSCNTSTSAATITVSDTLNAGNYSLAVRLDGANNAGMAIYYYNGIASGSNTVTCSTGATTVSYIRCLVSEWAGQGASTFDQSGTFQAASLGTSPLTVTTTGNTVNTNELLYASVGGNVAFSVGSGYTALNNSDSGQTIDEYKLTSTSGSTQSATFTFSPTVNLPIAAIATFK